MKFSLSLLLPALLLPTLLASDAAATQVFHVPTDQMAREADVIIHARVVGQRVQWDEQRERPMTLTDVEVIKNLKGAKAGEALTIYQVGGTLDGRRYRIPGSLRFVPGEEMVFFAASFQGMIVSFGMGQGKFTILEQGGKLVVAPEYGDVSWVQRSGERWVPAGQPKIQLQPLDVFIRTVGAALAKEGR